MALTRLEAKNLALDSKLYRLRQVSHGRERYSKKKQTKI